MQIKQVQFIKYKSYSPASLQLEGKCCLKNSFLIWRQDRLGVQHCLRAGAFVFLILVCANREYSICLQYEYYGPFFLSVNWQNAYK